VPTVTNISTYRFAPLENLRELREELIALCKREQLKGTILLAPEGINLFVAGLSDSIDFLLEKLRSIPGLEGLEPKVSLSDGQPFNRMLVRLKKEIISFGVEGVDPARHTSPKLAPKELKRWLDEGRPVTLLDTRNDYEVRLGTFKGAIDPDIPTFRKFPDAVRALPEELKNQPVVMFCTGGIRCEKAGPFMEMEGFSQIYQLDGGILKYFEECGGDHYDGDCFVFDQRVGVDPALRESDHAVCYACLAPLDAEDQSDPRYRAGVSCPYCHKSEPEKMAERIAELEAKIREFTTPLPGSVPMENRRPLHIPALHDKCRLEDALCDLLPQVSRDEWNKRLSEGRFISYGGAVRGGDHIVRAGERVLQVFPAEIEPDVSADIKVLYYDEALLVVHKPAPLPIHSGGRYHRNTLQNFLQSVMLPYVPRAVHRLDANTTGVLVFARTRHFSRLIQRQFLDGTVEKQYLAVVHGHPEDDEFFCDATISAEPGDLGLRSVNSEDGLSARTDFRVMERRENGTTLLEAKLGTGRTNQIRAHLWHLGFPIVGDPSYLPNSKTSDRQTLALGDAPMQLHAWMITLQHPISKETMTFVAERRL